MYAIVNIAGQQFRVEKDQKLFVHRLEQKEGESVSFDEVLMIDNDKSVIVGEPTIKGAMVSGKVISHPRGNKIKVFKKKRRKGYKVRTGHRQYLTEIQIESIIEEGSVKESTAKTAEKKETAPEKPAEVRTAATKPAKAAAAKRPAITDPETKDVKKTSAKKPVAKKPEASKPATAKPAAKKTAAARPAAKKPAANKTDTGKASKE